MSDELGYARPAKVNRVHKTRGTPLLAAPPVPDAPVLATAGDSTSRALTPGLNALALERGWGYVQAGQGGCSVVPLPLTSDPASAELRAEAEDCAESVPEVIDGAIADYDPDIWVLSDEFLRNYLVMPDGGYAAPGDPVHDEAVEAALTATLNRLTDTGAKVIVLAAVPNGPPADCVSDDDDCPPLNTVAGLRQSIR